MIESEQDFSQYMEFVKTLVVGDSVALKRRFFDQLILVKIIKKTIKHVVVECEGRELKIRIAIPIGDYFVPIQEYERSLRREERRQKAVYLMSLSYRHNLRTPFEGVSFASKGVRLTGNSLSDFRESIHKRIEELTEILSKIADLGADGMDLQDWLAGKDPANSDEKKYECARTEECDQWLRGCDPGPWCSGFAQSSARCCEDRG